MEEGQGSGVGSFITPPPAPSLHCKAPKCQSCGILISQVSLSRSVAFHFKVQRRSSYGIRSYYAVLVFILRYHAFSRRASSHLAVSRRFSQDRVSSRGITLFLGGPRRISQRPFPSEQIQLAKHPIPLASIFGLSPDIAIILIYPTP